MKAGGHAATFGRRRTSYPRLLRRRTRLVVVRLRCLLIKERLSEFLEGNGFGEHVEHGDQDLVRDGHGGPLGAPARLQPVVLVLVVAALRPGGADRGLNEGRLEVDVALAGGRALLLSGALVIAGADPGPGGQAPGVAEHGHVDADLRDDRHARSGRQHRGSAGAVAAAPRRAGPSPRCARRARADPPRSPRPAGGGRPAGSGDARSAGRPAPGPAAPACGANSASPGPPSPAAWRCSRSAPSSSPGRRRRTSAAHWASCLLRFTGSASSLFPFDPLVALVSLDALLSFGALVGMLVLRIAGSTGCSQR